MTDLINRADALAAITLGDTVTALHRKIAAIPAVTQPPAQVRVKPLVGWVVANDQGNRWRCVWKWETNAEWTDDISKAIKFATRGDAEVFSADDEDAWLIQEVPIPTIDTTPDNRDAVIARLVEALTPFDAVSIEMFSRNYNASDIVLTVGPVSGTCLTFRDFLNVRAALAAAKEVKLLAG